MIFLPHDRFHIPLQMFLQEFPVCFLLQEPCEKFVHIMKHILKRFIQPPRVDKSRPQHIQIDSCIMPERK